MRTFSTGRSSHLLCTNTIRISIKLKSYLMLKPEAYQYQSQLSTKSRFPYFQNLLRPLSTPLWQHNQLQKTDFPEWDSGDPIPSPFLFWYYYRTSQALEAMEEPHRSQMRLLSNWIDQGYRDVYADDVEELFDRGFVSKSTMPFFLKPGDVVVSKHEDITNSSIVLSWSDITNEKTKSTNWQAKTWSYKFDGSFYKVESELSVSPKFDAEHGNILIQEL
ncbi:hypothetical protein PgNI_10321 [Pyricularia grisea]|uniref:DUF7025 domain-containing protein n=1 Tax=Pyricularia grisea TaxID=148305 RepID=A0A6P8AYH2_PYRGI|nr:hypothetical protein PgNI_10321 [Pyricularia grisea]TLD07339.1 hypothetical protein PgNI_10321 [Pyricularia grisea]